MKSLFYILSISVLIIFPDFIFSQNSEIPKNGLVLALEQSNLENNKWTDFSEFKNDGFLYNNSQQKERVSGIESIKFNNFSDYISIKNSESLNPSQGITIIVWFKLNDLIPNQNIISKGYTSFQIPYVQYSLKMYDYSPFNTPQFNLSLNDNLNVLNGKSILTINKWYMIACTYDKSEMKMFVNNVQDEVSINRSENISSYPTNLEIGRYPTAKSQHLNGNIGSVFLYNRGLTSIEIEQIWNSTKNNFGFIDEKQNNLIKGNGRIKLPDGKYIDGRYYEGDFTFYSKFEKPDSSTIKRNGKGVTFWKNSDVMMERGVYKNNLLDGFGETFREDGSKQYEGNWKEGKLNGIVKSFYSNGKVYYEGEFKNDLANGIGKIYNQNGHLYFEGEYVNGEIFGKGKIFYESGQVYQEGEFRYGKPNGIGKIFNLDGTTNFEGEFVDGKSVPKPSTPKIVDNSTNTEQSKNVQKDDKSKTMWERYQESKKNISKEESLKYAKEFLGNKCPACWGSGKMVLGGTDFPHKVCSGKGCRTCKWTGKVFEALKVKCQGCGGTGSMVDFNRVFKKKFEEDKLTKRRISNDCIIKDENGNIVKGVSSNYYVTNLHRLFNDKDELLGTLEFEYDHLRKAGIPSSLYTSVGKGIGEYIGSSYSNDNKYVSSNSKKLYITNGDNQCFYLAFAILVDGTK